MYNLGWSHFVPFIVTILGIVFTDLLIGIGLGMMVAISYILYGNYKKPYLFDIDENPNDNVIRFKLAEHLTFINKASILKTLSNIPDGSKVIIDASDSIDIDHDVIEIIEDFEESAPHRDIEVEIISRKRRAVPNQVKEFEYKVLNGSPNGNKKLVEV